MKSIQRKSLIQRSVCVCVCVCVLCVLYPALLPQIHIRALGYETTTSLAHPEHPSIL